MFCFVMKSNAIQKWVAIHVGIWIGDDNQVDPDGVRRVGGQRVDHAQEAVITDQNHVQAIVSRIIVIVTI